jgi:hypothetical protein
LPTARIRPFSTATAPSRITGELTGTTQGAGYKETAETEVTLRGMSGAEKKEGTPDDDKEGKETTYTITV